MTSEGLMLDQKSKNLTSKINKQLIQSTAVGSFVDAAQITRSLIQADEGWTIIVSILFGASFSFMVAIIDQLQIIIHLPTMNVQIPSNGM